MVGTVAIHQNILNLELMTVLQLFNKKRLIATSSVNCEATPFNPVKLIMVFHEVFPAKLS